jgi:hypothetical protein
MYVKIKLSLCLSNLALRQEDVLGETMQKFVFSCTRH